MANLDKFISESLGKYIDVDGLHDSQCVDLVNAWATGPYNLPYSRGNGKDKAHNMSRDYASHGWTFVSPSQPALPGDVVSWDHTWGGGYGHTAIVIRDEGNYLFTLTQNPGPTATARLSKRGLVGYARPPRQTVQTEKSPTADTYRTATPGLNIRTAPPANSKLASTYGSPLPNGTVWHSTGRTSTDQWGNTWIQGRTPWMLATNRQPAWVNARYLKKV